jgi:hypothetical protein
MALDAVERGLVSSSPESPDVSGLVVDISSEGGFVTLVALADGTTSMYTSTGGGTIGAGSHASVAQATQRLLTQVQLSLGDFEIRNDDGLPPSGFVRFHVLAPPRGRCLDVSDAAFWGEEDHELIPVIACVQDLMSSIRAAR